MRIKKALTSIALVIMSAMLAVIIWFRFAEDGPASDIYVAENSTPPVSEEIAPPTVAAAETSPPVSEEVMREDLPEVNITSWELRLVNTESPLPEDFIPEVTSLEGGQRFDSRAAAALQNFSDAARAEGLSVYVTSSYRSYATQKTLFENKVNEYIYSLGSREAAEAKARTIVAYPGTSEHQSALAVDIVDKYYEYMNESLADTELSKWMKDHCAEYGFILRYPEDKQGITGIMFEPWHFRYVGVEAARYIMDNGLCLEEFLAFYN